MYLSVAYIVSLSVCHSTVLVTKRVHKMIVTALRKRLTLCTWQKWMPFNTCHIIRRTASSPRPAVHWSRSSSTVWSTNSNTKYRCFLRQNTSIRFTKFSCRNCCTDGHSRVSKGLFVRSVLANISTKKWRVLWWRELIPKPPLALNAYEIWNCWWTCVNTEILCLIKASRR